jgi:carbon storage regulator
MCGEIAAAARSGKRTMLVLSRKKGEEIVIGDTMSVTIVDIRGDKVRVGIKAPREIPVHRREVKEAIDRAQAKQVTRRSRRDSSKG